MKALAFHRGLDPRIVEELPWRTIECYLVVHDLLNAQEVFAAFGEGK
ncbi:MULTISPECIES: hypothetical protein [Halorussus]|nr:hypothetical protein [Halorussus vallis]USZ75667.1 hypothetical protein NGM07_19840 [Halorussus vallis]USZ75722.1 hypothetical protein NGM07_20120 [Halorussus vallis]USZ75740.1 hypothetical protein NGM07_00065 [Halorussus vallis]